MDKLSIGNEMAQFDSKNREFFDELTDEEKRLQKISDDFDDWQNRGP